MNRIETSELIEMPFGVCAHGGPTNRVLGGGPVLPLRKRALLGVGNTRACQDLSVVIFLSVLA